jgi:hypothetical protein
VANSRVSTGNPKFGNSADAKQTLPGPGANGSNLGGLTDAQVRMNTNLSGVMTSRQLKKNKSGSSPV